MSAVTEYLDEFHGALDEPVPAVLTTEQVALRALLIAEEFGETMDEFHKIEKAMRAYGQQPTLEEKAKLAKELADLEYVIRGAARIFNFPQDAVLAEVHASNMSKFTAGVHRREDGKLEKGPAYVEADVEAVLRSHEAED
jgi:predicted HAD superfamily Cof-like phosphohydrolase